MTALFPVVLRELQSAARRRGIYRSRYIVGISSLAGGALVVFWAQHLPGKIPAGLALFWFVSAISALLCLVAGFLLTCDSISREKREGTLGLLFLTSLGLHEIVLGKMAAASVFGANAVLSIIPVLALSVCLGGVTGPQFWSMALGLLNLLVFSLSLGLFLSSFSKRESSAGGFFILIFGGWLLLGITFFVQSNLVLFPSLLYWHPLYPVAETSGLLPPVFGGRYFKTLGWNLVWSLMLLYFSCFATRLSFLRSTGAIKQTAFLQPSSSKRKRTVGGTPLLWLQGLDQNKEMFFWTLAAFIVCVMVMAGQSAGKVFHLTALFALHYFLVLVFAWKACHLMVGLKKNGIIEILLTTPITLGEILAGQQAALQQFFYKPRIIVLVLHGVYVVPAFARDPLGNDVALALFSLLLFFIESFSFIWLGFWQGWASKSSPFAFFKIMILQPLAWLPLLFVVSLVFFLAGKALPLPPLRVFLVGVASATIINLAFAMFGLFRLSTRFRKSISV